MPDMSNINFGMLFPQGTATPTAQTQVVNTPQQQGANIGSGIGSLLKGVFSPTPVTQANQAISKGMSSTPIQKLLSGLLPGSMQPKPAQASPGMLANNSQNSPQTASSLNTLSNQESTVNPNNLNSQGVANLGGSGAVNNTMSGRASSNDYITNAIQAAKATYPDDPVRGRLAVAQAIQESGLAGRPSQLATKHNNYFGIKGQGNAGTVNYHSKEYGEGGWSNPVSGFASFKSPSDSFQAHKQLMSKPRYSGVMKATNFEDAAKAVKQAGYATDPNYTQELVRINDQYLQGY